MNPIYSVVKEEYQSAGSSACGGCTTQGNQQMIVQVPQPLEGLYDAGPPPFLTKIYDMVDDQRIDGILSWSREGQSFVVWDPHAFSINLLPRYFKHNNFSSFVRQLNTYGFRKIDPDLWEFANEAFLRGQRHILKNIKRRKTPSQLPLPEEAINGAFEHLRNDKQVLMVELVNLRQQQQNTRAHLQAMELRIQGKEKKQQKMMSFLAKAMQNPEFVKKLVQNGKKSKLEEAIIKKRRQYIDQNGESSQNGEGSKLIKAEVEEFEDPFAFQVSELETLALEMQGFSRPKRTLDEVPNVLDEFDEEFWEELFTERSDEQVGVNGSENGEVEDVFLAYKLEFLGSIMD